MSSRLCRCEKKCARQVCQLGHPCTKKCFQDCGQCLYKMKKMVPMCGHMATMECRKDPHTWDCQDRCQWKLPCEHQCSGICGDCRKKNSHVAKCMVEVSCCCCFFVVFVSASVGLFRIQPQPKVASTEYNHNHSCPMLQVHSQKMQLSRSHVIQYT